MSRLALGAAAGLCLAACSTRGHTIQDELRSSVRSSAFAGSFVRFSMDGDDVYVHSGTVRRDGKRKFSPSAYARCATGRYGDFLATVETEGREACLDGIEPWISVFAGAISVLLTDVFGESAPILQLSVYVAPKDSNIDFEMKARVGADPVRIGFVTTTAMFEGLARRATTHAISHEVYHAAFHAIRARRSAVSFKALDLNGRLIEEGAAELFGACMSLRVDNVASRAESNVSINGRGGGVLTDAELVNMVEDSANAKMRSVSGIDLSVLGQAIANTVWTSVVGPDYLAVGDEPEGKRLLALCSADNLGGVDGMRRLLSNLAADGVDAPQFPVWSADVGRDYDQRYRSAHARRPAATPSQ